MRRRSHVGHNRHHWPFGLHSGSPEAFGLVGWWPITGVDGNRLRDFVGVACDLDFVNGAGPVTYPYGMGLDMNAAQRGAVSTPAPDYVKDLNPVTLVWLGSRLSSVGASGAPIFSLTANNTAASPFIAYGLGFDSGGGGTYVRGDMTDSGGTFRLVGPGIGYQIAIDTLIMLVLSIANGAQSLWHNGLLVASTTHSFNGGGATSTAELTLGDARGGGGQNVGLITYDARLYNRAWNASDVGAAWNNGSPWGLYSIPRLPERAIYFDLGGGATVPSGTNPDPGVLPTDIPLHFITITLQSGVIHGYAETPLSDPAGYYNDAGYKAPRILKVSQVRREMSDETGAFQAASWTVELADHDRVLRGLQAAGALVGAKVDLYLIDDAVRRLAADDTSDAFRVASGVITDHRGLPNFRYQLTIEDKCGNLLSAQTRDKKVPRLATVEADSIPILAPQFDGTVVPICYGLLSDETQAVPQGVVPARFVGEVDLSDLEGGSGTGVVDVYLVCGHAVTSVGSVFYNNPDTPDVRLRVPESSFGSILWCPHKTGWIAKTGQAGQYVDYNGLRYTVIFLSQTIPYTATFYNNDGTTETREINIAEYARNGNVTITVNLEGVDANGDGTGAALDDIDNIWQHFLTNFVFNDSSGIGGWEAVPAFGAYSLIDTATVAAAKAIADARVTGGYKAVYLIGRDNAQQSVFDVLRELCFSGDMNMFVNRHGQLCLSREDTAAASTITYDAQADLVEDDFQTHVRSDEFVNHINWRHSYRYADATAPRAQSPSGWATTERAVAPFQKWVSGTKTTTNSTSVTNVQQTIAGEVGEFDLYAIRLEAVATDVITKKLARRVGPTTSSDGARMVEAVTGLQGFEKTSVQVELGSMVSYTHPEGLTSTGWTAKKTRVEALVYDPMRNAVTHESRVMP